MSLSYSANNIIGGPFDPGVERQLSVRKKVVENQNSRTPEDILYLNSNTGWVRVTSSVNAYDKDLQKYSSDKAKIYQLVGGTLNASEGFNPQSEHSSYSQSEEYGYIPTPGITSFQVKSQGTFGTLRSATFNFTVHSPEDFSIMEQLYLRPGFTILLEWGHSLYLSNEDGLLQTTVNPFPLKKYLNRLSDSQIEKEIANLKGENSSNGIAGHSYNYDAMFGFIKNFVWNYNGINYECQVDVVSKGEVVESVKSTMAPLAEIQKPSKSDQETNEENKIAGEKYTPTVYASQVEAFLYAIKNSYSGNPDSIVKYLQDNNFSVIDSIIKRYSEIGETFKSFDTTTSVETGELFPKYITLRTLLMLFNEVSLPCESSTPIMTFFIGERIKGKRIKTSFTTFDEHIGIDQSICILPKAKKTNSESPIFYDASTKAGIGSNEESDILNIFLSVDFVISVFEERKKRETNENNTLYDVVKYDILQAIEKNLGIVNTFDIHTDHELSKFFVIDRRVVPNKKDMKSLIDLVGLKSEVSQLSIASKLTNNLTSMIAIAAQDDYSPSSNKDLLNIQKWNRGLRDRHYIKTTVGTGGQLKKEDYISVEVLKPYENYIKLVNELTAGIYDNFTLAEAAAPKADGLQDLHNQLMQEYVRQRTKQKYTNPPGLIPFELSFTMKGIAGIKIGQSFTVPDFFLPERYKGHVGFIVTGLDHLIQNNQWTLEVKSQMIFLS